MEAGAISRWQKSQLAGQTSQKSPRKNACGRKQSLNIRWKKQVQRQGEKQSIDTNIYMY